MGVKLREVVHITLIVLMVVGFLAHMWHQTNKFFTGLTTVGVSYEDRSRIKFPTFAFCDSRAYNVRQPFAATATLYNATAFNVEEEVVLSGVFGLADQATIMPVNHTVRVFPTTYNGLCKSYEFHDVNKVRSYGGKTTCSTVLSKMKPALVHSVGRFVYVLATIKTGNAKRVYFCTNMYTQAIGLEDLFYF